MNVQVENLEKNMAKLTVTVDAAELEKAITKAYNKQKNSISVPGFRKGKVPQNMVEKMYGAEIFYEDAANIIMQETYPQAYDESKLDIVSQPKIDITQLEKGKDFIYTAEVAVKPEVKLGKYKGVSVTKVDSKVTATEVNNTIKAELERDARMVSKTGKASKGDTAVIDFEGFIDDKAFEGGKGENYDLELGSGSFIPGFEDQLIGHKAGEDVDVEVTFPENYQAEDLAGKPAVFKCKLHEVKEKEVPALDDDFADDAGFDSVDEYKADVKKKLEEKKENEAKNKKEQAILDKLNSEPEMDIPEAMLVSAARQSLEQFSQQLMMQGMSIDQYYKFTGLNENAMIEQSKPSAEKRIKSRLVMEAVADAEGFTATDEDYDKEIEDMAKSYNLKAEDLKNMMRPRDEKSIRKDIVIKKALDFVIENAVEK